MTRGQIAIITPDGRLITSAEFNGDMYYDGVGHGKEVVEALESIETEEEYRSLSMISTTKILSTRIGSCFTIATTVFTICQQTTSASGFPITFISKTFRTGRSCLPTLINRKSCLNPMR